MIENANTRVITADQGKLVKTEFWMIVPFLVLSRLSARALIQSKDPLKIMAKDFIDEGNQRIFENEQIPILEWESAY